MTPYIDPRESIEAVKTSGVKDTAQRATITYVLGSCHPLVHVRRKRIQCDLMRAFKVAQHLSFDCMIMSFNIAKCRSQEICCPAM